MIEITEEQVLAEVGRLHMENQLLRAALVVEREKVEALERNLEAGSVPAVENPK